MPDRAFDEYLQRLLRQMRLSRAERAEIADELRDHFNQRYDALIGRGLSPEEAAGRALDEFGEAAAVAAEFSRIGRERTRRWVMRATIGSMTVTAAALLVGLALWPGPKGGPAVDQAVAQPKEDQTEAEPATKTRRVTEDELNAKTAERLSGITQVDLVDTPLDEVVVRIGEQLGVQFYIDRESLDEEGVGTDAAINLQLRDVPADMALELVLKQLGLRYMLRNGLVIVTTPTEMEDFLVVRVYDVRDLLAERRQTPVGLELDANVDGQSGGGGGGLGGGGGGGFGGGGGGGGGGGFFQIGGGSFGKGDAPSGRFPARADMVRDLYRLAQSLSDSLAKGDDTATLDAALKVRLLAHRLLMPSVEDRDKQAIDDLSKIITTAIVPDSWDEVGGSGSIGHFEGAFIISQTPTVHVEIRQFLEELRTVAQRGSEEPVTRGIPSTAPSSAANDHPAPATSSSRAGGGQVGPQQAERPAEKTGGVEGGQGAHEDPADDPFGASKN